jgi:hypothetical protein
MCCLRAEPGGSARPLTRPAAEHLSLELIGKTPQASGLFPLGLRPETQPLGSDLGNVLGLTRQVLRRHGEQLGRGGNLTNRPRELALERPPRGVQGSWAYTTVAVVSS